MQTAPSAFEIHAERLWRRNDYSGHAYCCATKPGKLCIRCALEANVPCCERPTRIHPTMIQPVPSASAEAPRYLSPSERVPAPLHACARQTTCSTSVAKVPMAKKPKAHARTICSPADADCSAENASMPLSMERMVTRVRVERRRAAPSLDSEAAVLCCHAIAAGRGRPGLSGHDSIHWRVGYGEIKEYCAFEGYMSERAVPSLPSSGITRGRDSACSKIWTL